MRVLLCFFAIIGFSAKGDSFVDRLMNSVRDAKAPTQQAKPVAQGSAQAIQPTHKTRSPQSNQSSGGSSPQAFDKWWPACILIDEKFGDANETVKGLVEHAAACKVVLEVYPITIKGNYPEDAKTINTNAKKACNLPDVLPDADKASVQTLGRHMSSPGDMCGSPGASGCAEVGGGGGGGGELSKEELAQKQAGGHFGGYASGNVLASITNAPGASLASHEMLGHNVISKPNGEEYGNGIGEEKKASLRGVKRRVAAAPSKPSGVFNSAGCALMRSQGLDNDGSHTYDPDLETYYVPGDPEDLMAGRSFFGDPPSETVTPPSKPVRPIQQSTSKPTPILASGHKKKGLSAGGKSTPPAVDDDLSGTRVSFSEKVDLSGKGGSTSIEFFDDGSKDEKTETALKEDFFEVGGEGGSTSVEFFDDGSKDGNGPSFGKDFFGTIREAIGDATESFTEQEWDEVEDDKLISENFAQAEEVSTEGEPFFEGGQIESSLDENYVDNLRVGTLPAIHVPRKIQEVSEDYGN